MRGAVPVAERGPDVVAPPPLVFAGPLLAGLLLDRLFPPPPLPRAARLAGAPLLAAGLALGGWFFTAMRRAGTPVDPREPARALVREGPFRLTRNPAYASLAADYSGLALLAGGRWPLLLLPVALAAVDLGVVRREERYLEERFGEAYRDYRRHVRRWL
jgi:protein-S-isoprenylcysteine O-methyltransferase Ste14